MLNDSVELAIDILEFIVNRGFIARFIDDFLIVLDTAVTFLPRIGLVLGYVSYFVDLPLILPLIILCLLSVSVRIAVALFGALVTLAHSLLDSIPFIG